MQSPADEQPLRGELFSVSQLEEHARALAGWHDVGGAATRRQPDRLLPRLRANERVLRDAYDVVTEAVKRGRRITPAAEWFLDNYHLIEEQIRTARRHLPRGYSRELPRLTSGPSAGPAAGLRHRAGADLPRGRPRRRRKPAGVRGGVPIGPAVAAGRAVGDPDHAPAGAAGEPPAGGGSRDDGAGGSGNGRSTGSSGCSRSSAQGAGRGGARAGGHGAGEPAADDGVRRRVREPAAGTGARPGVRGHLARAAAGRTGADDRARVPAGEPEPGRSTRSRSATASAACGSSARRSGATSSRR